MTHQVGDSVEFGNKRGVVVTAPRRGSTYIVRTVDGRQYKVPAAMLRAAAVAVEGAAAMVDAGQDFMVDRDAKLAARREARQPAREAAIAKAAAQLAYRFEGMHKGDFYKYLGAAGHPRVMVLELHPAEGKVTITNPKAELLETAKILGWAGAEGVHAKSSIKVWVNRLARIAL